MLAEKKVMIQFNESTNMLIDVKNKSKDSKIKKNIILKYTSNRLCVVMRTVHIRCEIETRICGCESGAENEGFIRTEAFLD
jgi:hypothetical protein